MAVDEFGWGTPDPEPVDDQTIEQTMAYQMLNNKVNQLMEMDDVDPVDIVLSLNALAGELAAFVIDYLEGRN